MPFSSNDCRYMARAIALARRGRFTTAPNPNVGCVIVKEGQVIGEGAHLRAGEAHAEVNAMASASAMLSGSTVYVTLEPCSHFGRTPPCAQALIDNQVAEVVIGMQDPNPLVAGRGVAMLQNAGIRVRIGLMAEQVAALNPGFLSRIERNRPFIRLKMGASLDGKTALANGASQWITSPESRRDVQRERAASHGILSTAQTVIADNASLNVRSEELGWLSQIYPCDRIRQPSRIIIDRRQQLTGQEKLFGSSGQIMQVIDRPCDAPVAETLVVPPSKSWLVDLMHALGRAEINDLWVEAGASLAGALLDAHLVDQLILYQAPLLMGCDSRSLANTRRLEDMSALQHWSVVDQRRIGSDWKTIFEPSRSALEY